VLRQFILGMCFSFILFLGYKTTDHKNECTVVFHPLFLTRIHVTSHVKTSNKLKCSKVFCLLFFSRPNSFQIPSNGDESVRISNPQLCLGLYGFVSRERWSTDSLRNETSLLSYQV